MSIFKRSAGIVNYLQRADPAYRWRMETRACPLCGPTVYLAFSPNPFMVRCLKCRANVTNLAIAAAVRQSIPDISQVSAYEMSTYGATYEFLKGNCRLLQCSEYFPDAKPGEFIHGVRNEDVQQLSFPHESFDLITSNQVFEHVPDTGKALGECRRVLKTGGLLVFTVPLYDTAKTEQVATIAGGEPCLAFYAGISLEPEHGAELRPGVLAFLGQRHCLDSVSGLFL